jgi:transcriptional regulator with XRE-family HTH domain
MSERQVAGKIGVDPRKLAAWRTGRTLPNVYEAASLAAALRVNEDLFRNPPPVPEPSSS